MRAATLELVDAEWRRSEQGGWRRLLPSSRSQHYAQFVGEERREMHLLPFAVDGGERESSSYKPLA